MTILLRRLAPFAAAALLAAFGLATLPLAVRSAAAGEGDATSARSDAEARLAQVDRHDATAAYKLALDLAAKGYADLATKAYEIVVGLEPDHLAARRALGFERADGKWLKGDDLQRAKGFVRHQNKWMTSEEFAAATRPQREAAEQKAGEEKVQALLSKIATQDADLVMPARRALGGMEDKFKLAPLAKALRCEPAALRVFAAGELARIGDTLAIPALLKRVIYDPDPKAREAMGAALKSFAEPSTLEPLVRAMDSKFSDTRVRATEAIGMLGDQAALGQVIVRWEARSGNYPNVYFAQMKQISYIQDFDVEVAQTSFIADPIVGVLQEGVVQSVKILATEQTYYTVERTALHDAASKLAGLDLGNDTKAWMKFWNENKERLLREREEAYRKASAERAAARAAADAKPAETK